MTTDPDLTAHHATALAYVTGERRRQEQHVASGRFTHTAAAPGYPDLLRLAIITEELGEAAEHALAPEDLTAGLLDNLAAGEMLTHLRHAETLARHTNDDDHTTALEVLTDLATVDPAEAAVTAADTLRRAALFAELVQVAASAVAAIEGLLAEGVRP